MRPEEYAFADTPEICAAIGLEWREGGYGLLFCRDGSGDKVTLVTEDADYVRLLEAGAGVGVLGGLEIDPGKFPIQRSGWPPEWKP